MTQTLAPLIISLGKNIGMLSLEMTIVPAQIFTNPTSVVVLNAILIILLIIYFLFVPTLYACVKFNAYNPLKIFTAYIRSNLRCQMENGTIRMVPTVPVILNKRNVCCGVTFVLLHAIAWPSLVVWILIDVGLLLFLLLPRVLRFIRKTPTDIMNPGSVKNSRGGFGSAMSEPSNGRTCNTSEGMRIRSSSRRTKYDHEFSRYTPDYRDTRTPLPTISAIRNKLSYRYNIVF